MTQITNQYISHLLSCALASVEPQPIPEGLRWETLLHIAEFHSVSATIFPALSTLDVPAECLSQWRECHQKSVVRELMFQHAREGIFQNFEAKGIRYMPLKGIILNNYYPNVGMRTFCDNDILVDMENVNQVHKIMGELGYKAHLHFNTEHNTYEKPPILNFEIHKALLVKGTPHADYWSDVWKRAQVVSGCQYALSHEDYYLYFLVHFYKHFTSGGCGIRALADNHQLLHHLAHEMDWDYLHRELEKLDMMNFYREIDNLTKLLFHDPASLPNLKEEEATLLATIMKAGTYGTQTQSIDKRLEKNKGGKLVYLLSRIFPTYRYCCSYFPGVDKYPPLYLLAFLPMTLYRGYRMCVRWKHVKGEVRHVMGK